MLKPLMISALLIAVLAGLAAGGDDTRMVVKAAKIYVGDGTVLENAAILIEDGRIVQVGGAIDVDDDTPSIDSESGVITAGLIDAASTAGVVSKGTWTEHSSEIVPHMRTLDAVDLRHRDFERLAREGVTAVYVTPGSGSVVGNRGCILKTAGPLDERVVVAEDSVKASLGRDSYRRGMRNRSPYGRTTFMTRRPTTRMGVTAVFQDAFLAAAKYRDARAGSGNKPPFDPALETLAGVLDGTIPFRVQARNDRDIWSAIRLCGEFGVDFVLEEAIEAYRCIPELKAHGAKVIYGPVFIYPAGYRAGTGEANRPCLNTAGILREAGLDVALTASDLTGESSLPHQAGFAMRAGLSFEDALAAVTAAPAKILGVDGRMGMIKAGLDADLVLWSGEPFAPTTRPITVLVDGKPVYVLGLSDSELKSLGAAGEESAD